MSREDDILAAIDEMDGFDFQKLARRLLKRELFPTLNPLPDQNDLGQDAQTEELPVKELPALNRKKATFAISKTNTKTKLQKDCDRCREIGHDIKTFIFATSGKVRNNLQKRWKRDIQGEYGWKLVIYERTWFADVVTQPKHEKLIEEMLGIPPLNGDYYADIVNEFERETESTLAGITETIPHLDRQLSRSEVSDVRTQLATGNRVVVTGEGGVGKTGVLSQIVEQVTDGPVLFIDARRYSECSTITDLRHKFDFNGSLSDAVARVGRHNRCLVIVDQLDNIAGTPAASVFTDFLTSVSEMNDVHLVAACRSWDMKNQRVYGSLADEEAFATVTVSELAPSQVRNILTDLRIIKYSDELLSIGQNILNLSIIAELQAQTDQPQIDFTEITTQVELWGKYQETLVERETQGGKWDEKSGNEVRARAIELSRSGLQDGSRFFPISLRRERPDKRLISRKVIVSNDVGERYQFWHEELQDYFYAWDAVSRRGWTTPQEVLKEIDERVAAGVFRWMLRIQLKHGAVPAMEFLDAALSDNGLGYYASSHILDEITTWDPAEIDDGVVDIALSQINANEQFREYFYTNLETPAWVSMLHNGEQFEEPSGPIMTYLDRIATDRPNLAVDIIQSTDTDHRGTQAYFVKIAKQLPVEQATQCVDVFTDWLPTAETELDGYAVHYTDFIEELLKENAVESAFFLLSALIEPQSPEPEIIEQELKNGETYEYKRQTEATAVASVHTIKTAIETVVTNLHSEDAEDFIKVLEDPLRQAILLEAEVLDTDPVELAWPQYAGGLNLNNLKLKEVLLKKLRTFLKEWITTAPSTPNRSNLIVRYLDDIPIFQRLGLYLLSKNPTVFPELVREELFTEENYDAYLIRDEFFQLLRDGFPVLSATEQEHILEIIDDGPDRDELLEAVEERAERFPDRDIGDVVDQEIDLWQLRRLWRVRDHLSDDRADRIEQLVDTYGEPDGLERERAGRMRKASTEESRNTDELRNLSPDDLFTLCVDPDSNNDDIDVPSEISPHDLAQDVQVFVAESPTQFIPHLSILTDAESIYIANVLKGLRDALDGDRDFEWDAVLELCQETTTRDDAQAALSRKRTCRLLSKGLSEDSSNLLDHQDVIRDILLTLSNDPEPSLEDEDYEYLSHDRPLRTSINAVRPIAVDTLITYALERAKIEGFDGFSEEQESGLEPAVRRCLIEKMADPSTAVHCVFGKRLRNLYWIDRNLAEEHINTIFPMDDDTESRDRFSAAWAAYLSSTPWVEGLYQDLKDRYLYAVNLHNAEDRFTGRTEGDRFVGHALYPYLHADEPLTEDDSILPYFYANTSPDTARSAAWQLWWWADENPEFCEEWATVRELWEWRLNVVSDDHETYAKEFKWFVEWLDLISEEIEPTTVESLLQDTIPFLAHHRRAWKTLESYLAQWVDKFPHCCVALYAALLRQPQRPGYLMFEEEARTILTTALEAGDDTKDLALEVTELVAEHDQAFLDLIRKYSID